MGLQKPEELMRPLPVEPTRFRVSTLLSLDTRAIHQLALRAVGTVTCYKVHVGRCLLVMKERKGYREFGCSCENHYARAKLGLSNRMANSCKRVARALLGLPELTLAAERGQIAWGKLREIVRKASPETEELWLELSLKYNDEQIQALVSRTPKGALPGDLDEDNDSYQSELRCPLAPEVFALLERARRMFSVENEKAVTTAEVLEQALVSYISSQPLDEKSLNKVREEADNDLQAERARLIPLVAEARELAEEMGLLDLNDRCSCSVDQDDTCGDNSNEVAPSTRAGHPDLRELINEAIHPHSMEVEASWLEDLGRPGRVELGKSAVAKSTLDNPLNNTRLRFNPLTRHTTKAQRTEILRRDNWCCSCPGCPNKVWLQIHHLESYSEGGKTEPRNLLSLCAACHRNVHLGFLKINEDSDGRLIFRGQDGQRLDIQEDLIIAGWLDWEIGWTGHEHNSYTLRHGRDWVVFADDVAGWAC